jgi:hypothetical protein
MSLMALALLAAALQTATVAKAAGQDADADTSWAAAAQDIGEVAKDQVQSIAADQEKQAAERQAAPTAETSPQAVITVVESKDDSTRVAGAGKGLRSDEFPIDPKAAQLASYVEKILFKPADAVATDYSWRRNSWGVCRAWLTCASGRQISCWAEGWNCDAYSNAGDNANVFCKSWSNDGQWSSSWDTCP